ncbi:hypothetical protein RJ639_001786 [Escallonia herrerae]|uniref:Probable 6-phosphogluconolactonase n=1 Tax=Escallonia herrerae TaxID=1293975 RepID=A0AA88X9F8_9ASTE|nr:hypothetical protein RJ639_001786 [Escallonia herrerae]
MTASSQSFAVTLCSLATRSRSLRQSLPPPNLRLTLRPAGQSPILRLIGPVASPSGNKHTHRIKAAETEMATEKGKGNVQVYDTEEDLSVSLAKYTAELSEKYAMERGAFTVWSKWHVFWVDERVVPKDHPDSNYLLAYDGLLSKVPILPGNVFAINDALSAKAAADDYETCVKHLVKNKIIDISEANGFPKFDLMLLGMGPDGHVASLFPGHPCLEENKQWVTFVEDSPKPPPERITFTFPVINSSANIALVVAGSGKAHPVHVALGDGQSPDLLPVQMVSPEGELTWFLDKQAASKL